MTTTATRDLHEPELELAGTNVPSSPRSQLLRQRPLLLGSLIAVLGAGYWTYAQGFESTDDAQIDGDISSVSARVAGTVAHVSVAAGQRVEKGQPIAQLDRTDLAVQLARAEAAQSQASAELAGDLPAVAIAESLNEGELGRAAAELASETAALAWARSELVRASAELARGEVLERQARLDHQRAEQLYRGQVIARAELDSRSTALESASAGVRALGEAMTAAAERVAQARARLESARAVQKQTSSNAPRQLETRRAMVLSRQAGLAAAEAALEQARNNLAYTTVVSPVSGVVGRKSISEGDRVAEGQPLVAIAQVEQLWVTANYRETQIEQIRAGQPASIHVDALDLDLKGTVESIGGATGARLSLFPPENAVGNYVKVVQRVPVRIALARDQPGSERLRIGMSVDARVEF